jgi:predicted RNase H-like HicB family nuclease
MKSKLNMIYWKSDKFWLGKLLEHPEIMTQGETLEELEENLRDAYLMMAMEEDVPENCDGQATYRIWESIRSGRHPRYSAVRCRAHRAKPICRTDPGNPGTVAQIDPPQDNSGG